MPEITVHHRPLPKARPRLGRGGRVYTPTTTQEAERRIREAWVATWGEAPLEGALRLRVEAHVPRPVAHYSRRAGTGLVPSAPPWPTTKPDLDNYVKTVLDALNGVAYRDDGQVIDLHASKRYTTDAPKWVISVSIVVPHKSIEVLE